MVTFRGFGPIGSSYWAKNPVANHTRLRVAFVNLGDHKNVGIVEAHG